MTASLQFISSYARVLIWVSSFYLPLRLLFDEIFVKYHQWCLINDLWCINENISCVTLLDLSIILCLNYAVMKVLNIKVFYEKRYKERN